MEGGIEVRDSVITGDVSINTNPIRVECPGCKKSGLLTLYNCESKISVKCFDRICDECHKKDSACTMCRKKEHNLDIQGERKTLQKKLEKKELLIEHFDEKLWKHDVISKCTKLGWPLLILSTIALTSMLTWFSPYIAQQRASEIVMIPMLIGTLLVIPSFYGGIAYFWLLVGKSVLEQQITELEEE